MIDFILLFPKENAQSELITQFDIEPTGITPRTVSWSGAGVRSIPKAKRIATQLHAELEWEYCGPGGRKYEITPGFKRAWLLGQLSLEQPTKFHQKLHTWRLMDEAVIRAYHHAQWGHGPWNISQFHQWLTALKIFDSAENQDWLEYERAHIRAAARTAQGNEYHPYDRGTNGQYATVLHAQMTRERKIAQRFDKARSYIALAKTDDVQTLAELRSLYIFRQQLPKTAELAEYINYEMTEIRRIIRDKHHGIKDPWVGR